MAESLGGVAGHQNGTCKYISKIARQMKIYANIARENLPSRARNLFFSFCRVDQNKGEKFRIVYVRETALYGPQSTRPRLTCSWLPAPRPPRNVGRARGSRTQTAVSTRHAAAARRGAAHRIVARPLPSAARLGSYGGCRAVWVRAHPGHFYSLAAAKTYRSTTR